jgi:hypothetical protein
MGAIISKLWTPMTFIEKRRLKSTVVGGGVHYPRQWEGDQPPLLSGQAGPGPGRGAKSSLTQASPL